MVDKMYNTDDLLTRAYDILSEMKDNDQSSFVAPDIKLKDRKTYIHNIDAFCESANRKVEDIIAFIKSELSDELSISMCNEGLKINRIFKIDIMKKTIKNYIHKFVLCRSCKSKKTNIVNINRQKFLVCDSCKCEICL